MGKESSWRLQRDTGEKLWYPIWRYKSLIILEVVLSIILIVIGYTVNNDYFRGVGVGLVIAWVTGALAYWQYLSSHKHNKN